jgi:hypothetical protein
MDAEEYIKQYFKEKRGIDLIERGQDEHGFTFRDAGSNIFVEVRTAPLEGLSKSLFNLFTDAGYERAKSCLKQKTEYEIHLILTQEGRIAEHYLIPANVFMERARPYQSTVWELPLEEIREYRVEST